jgi:hypothetical protein
MQKPLDRFWCLTPGSVPRIIVVVGSINLALVARERLPQSGERASPDHADSWD